MPNHRTLKRALETVGTVAVVFTAVYALVAITSRGDWWRAMVTSAGRD